MITGDIGCYTLGSAAPLNALDTTFCMGGSISTGHGASVALRNAGSDLKVVSVIGDSTFFHSGITSLIDAVYNKGSNTIVILDNRITGMTGHQENPGTGYTLMGDETTEVDIPALCKAIGMKEENIYIVNPNHMKEVRKALDEAIAKDEATVIITKWPCALKRFSKEDKERFDLTPKKLDEMYIQETEWKDPRFEVEPQDNDAPLQDVGNVLFRGEVLKALKGDGGLLFISTELLKPVSGKKEELVFFGRSMEGKAPLVAVFGDMLCGGLIAPLDGTAVMEKLEKITREPLWDWDGTGEKETVEQTRI
jgi:pyruvate/2-oxoacid:ferredoxin oxidoreductase beta subunit